ncbi:Endonuclease_NS domain-containing protein, partial [Meloidogyne graminicola]
LNNLIKYPKTTHFFKILLIEFEKENYCLDILISRATRTEINENKFNENISIDCGKKILNEYGNNWNEQLNFIEWYLGIDLNDLLNIIGINKFKEEIKWINCSNEQIMMKNILNKKTNKINNINIILPSFEQKFLKIIENEENNQNIRLYNDFLISFDRKRKIPKWALEILDPLKINKIESSHRYPIWEKDPKFKTEYQPIYHDYDDGKKYDLEHGHMVPAYNHPFNVKQTFYFTNSVPQNKYINKVVWQKMEKQIYCKAYPF